MTAKEDRVKTKDWMKQNTARVELLEKRWKELRPLPVEELLGLALELDVPLEDVKDKLATKIIQNEVGDQTK